MAARIGRIPIDYDNVLLRRQIALRIAALGTTAEQYDALVDYDASLLAMTLRAMSTGQLTALYEHASGRLPPMPPTLNVKWDARRELRKRGVTVGAAGLRR